MSNRLRHKQEAVRPTPRELVRDPQPERANKVADQLINSCLTHIRHNMQEEGTLRDIASDAVRVYLCADLWSNPKKGFSKKATYEDLDLSVRKVTEARLQCVRRKWAECDTRFPIYEKGRLVRKVTIPRHKQWGNAAVLSREPRKGEAEKRSFLFDDSIESRTSIHKPTTNGSLDFNRSHDKLKTALGQLPEKERWAVQQVVLNKRRQYDVAEELECSQSQVSKLKEAALKRLGRLM